MKKITLFFIFFATSITTMAQNDPIAYKKALQKMIVSMGVEKTYTAAIQQMTVLMRQQNPQMPKATWDKMSATFTQKSLNGLVDKLVPIYKKHLSLSDINQMTAFFETPVGKKYASKLPLITQESMTVGREWGMEMAKQMQKEISKK